MAVVWLQHTYKSTQGIYASLHWNILCFCASGLHNIADIKRQNLTEYPTLSSLEDAGVVF